MKILYQLENPSFKVSKSDRILLNYIRENAETFCTKPIATLAVNCGVSEATITRFVRKMGFASLQLFKLALAEELVDGKKQMVISKDISCNEDIQTTAKKLLANNVATLEQTVNFLNEELVEESVKYIKEAKRVFFIGVGNSGFVANDSAYKFMRIGMDAKGIDNSHFIMLQMALLTHDDVVIIVTHSGKSFEIMEAIRLIKQNGAKLIVITANKNIAIKDLADCCIFYESCNSMLETSSITTKLTQIFIIDLIYTQIVKETIDLSSSFKRKTSEAINMLRLADLKNKF